LDLRPAPRWRQFGGTPPTPPRALDDEVRERDYEFVCSDTTRQLVNTALLLRRPLLITGNPGTGKSTLPYHVSRKLGLGTVLRWNITSRSTLADGLYKYDALRRLNDASLRRSVGEAKDPPPIEDYITLGPLGTALLPSARPRVLLIDELDKSDVDLANDLLHAFEEARFQIPELKQELAAKGRDSAQVRDDEGKPVETPGDIEACAFPFVVLTSNAEREFPPAFLRRCVRLHMPDANPKELTQIAEAHLKNVDGDLLRDLVDRFEKNRKQGVVANDQLLNALYLASGVSTEEMGEEQRDKVVAMLLAPLNRAGAS